MIGVDRLTQNTMDSESQKKIQEPDGWVGWSKEILDPTLAFQSTAWIQNPSLSRVWQTRKDKTQVESVQLEQTFDF